MAAAAVGTSLLGQAGPMADDGEAGTPMTRETAVMMRPHLLITAERLGDLRSLDDLREAIEDGHARELWEHILQEAEADLRHEPLVPTSVFPGRGGVEAERGNREYRLVHATACRIRGSALVALVTGDERFRDAALAQIECVFDEDRWPDWRDMAHLRYPADLRTGQLAMAIGLAYDWLHPALSAEQRAMIVEGLDRRAIRPFWECVDKAVGWTRGTNNWTTCIVGGLGIAGMALGEDHPDGERLVEFSLEQMGRYLTVLGPEGDFNESVGYAGAMRLPAQYFAALRYHSDGTENLLSCAPFIGGCRWIMYQTVAPGRMVPFGDAHPGAPPPASAFSAVAAAAQDPVLQWFYLQNADVRRFEHPVIALLTFDDRIEPTSPEGEMPHSRAYGAFGALISSRTGWEPWAARGVRCTVHSKAGIEQNHEHHDAGQVIINGFGRRLIVDLGSPSNYPPDYGPPTRWEYYNASSWGHNVLNLVGHEMQGERDQQSPHVLSAFDDNLGGCWRIELTLFYAGAEAVSRTVVHIRPGVVAVLDDAELASPEEIRLRWHTVDRCDPDEEGRFTVENEGVRLVSRVIRLDGEEITVERGEHAYEAPFDTGRNGAPLTQRHESFIEARLEGRRCRLLSAFAVFGPNEEIGAWERTEGGLRLEAPDRAVSVTVTDDELVVTNERAEAQWRMSL
ncbi:MAG: heparinase II/III family protein [Armatimonadota bacterium]|nr:heparinase II/III family protein [Armatimonadota bacterium]